MFWKGFEDSNALVKDTLPGSLEMSISIVVKSALYRTLELRKGIEHRKESNSHQLSK